MHRLEAAGQGRRSSPTHPTVTAPPSATWAPAGGRSDRPTCAGQSAAEKQPGASPEVQTAGIPAHVLCYGIGAAARTQAQKGQGETSPTDLPGSPPGGCKCHPHQQDPVPQEDRQSRAQRGASPESQAVPQPRLRGPALPQRGCARKAPCAARGDDSTAQVWSTSTSRA